MHELTQYDRCDNSNCEDEPNRPTVRLGRLLDGSVKEGGLHRCLLPQVPAHLGDYAACLHRRKLQGRGVLDYAFSSAGTQTTIASFSFHHLFEQLSTFGGRKSRIGVQNDTFSLALVVVRIN